MEFNEEKPIYIQLYEEIEDDILKGILKEDYGIPSTNEYAVNYKINPATARKAFNMLTEEGVIYKKRGIGMFVSKGGRKIIEDKRKKNFYNTFIKNALEEGEKLGLSALDIINMIKEGKELWEI